MTWGSRRATLALATAACLFAAGAGTAQAFTTPPVWQCRASAVYASVAGNNRLEPIVANGNINTAGGKSPDRAQCVSGEAGAGNAATQLGIPQDLLGARTARAITGIEPELGRAIDQRVGSLAGVEDLTLQLPQGGVVTLGIALANSSAGGACANGQPMLLGASQVTGITLNGTTVSLDGLLAALTAALAPLNAVVDLQINEQIRDATSLTVRALHLKVLQGGAGGTPLVDIVVAESKAGFNGPVCDPNAQNDGSGPGGGGNRDIRPCPSGAQFDVPSGNCIIPASSGSSFGTIVVGRPFQGPSGGRVIPTDIARRRFPRSPCVRGEGPRFTIIGTNGADRITGTNRADRILGLGGNDQIAGGRGNDCIEGNNGRDNLSGGLGNDRIFGGAGNDALNGGPGTDRLSGGRGNDTINGAFGADRVFGGPGNDAINVATAGPAATISCGTGRDKLRINTNERRRHRGCEIVYTLGGPAGPRG